MKSIDRSEIARELYGAEWFNAPEFVRDAAEDFVEYLLAADVSDLVSGNAEDRVHEFADGAVPVYNYHRYAVLTDPAAVRAIEANLDEYGADAVRDNDGAINFSHLVGVGMYGAIASKCSHMLRTLQRGDCWQAFNLNDDAAEVAAILLPEWSGTLAEMLAEALRLDAEMQEFLIENMPKATITRAAPVLLSTVYNMDTWRAM